jgi:hypothetical protein
MIFFSVGLPSRFAELCDALTVRLAERSLGAVTAGIVNTLDDVARVAIRTDAAHFVAASRQPVVRLQAEIIQTGRPFLVTLGAVHSALYELLQRPGYDLATATREIAGSCAAMLTLTAAPAALVLSSGGEDDPTALATAIARHFGFTLSPGEIDAVAESIETAAEGEVREESGWLDQLGARERAIINGALEPYVRYFNGGGELEPIVWEPDLFFAAEGAADGAPIPASGPIDITGRARFLIFGPYINLAPGLWSATAVIGFSAETTGLSFVIEIAAGTRLTYARVQPTGEQVIETDLQFTIDDSATQPVEVRIISERAAFDGRVVLGHVRLVPRAGVHNEIQQRLIEALRR